MILFSFYLTLYILLPSSLVNYCIACYQLYFYIWNAFKLFFQLASSFNEILACRFWVHYWPTLTTNIAYNICMWNVCRGRLCVILNNLWVTYSLTICFTMHAFNTSLITQGIHHMKSYWMWRKISFSFHFLQKHLKLWWMYSMF